MSRVKIVATIGPRSDNAGTLAALREAGMNVARLNGSHADLEWHGKTVELIRRTVPDVPILLDLPGSKIRTTKLSQELVVTEGQKVFLTTRQDGTDIAKVVVDYPELSQHVGIGDRITMDDGSLTLVVDDIDGHDVVCHTTHAGAFRNGQGVHLPRLTRTPGLLSDRDRELIAFAVSSGIDFVGISFVETPADVHAVREITGESGPQIVCKIETEKSLEHVGELAELSDALMIDRGDLSVETNLETIGLLQKVILSEATLAAKPVIVATEILQSMIHSPVPTKAEVSDITNLVLDGAAALMLSGETAVGEFPVEAVSLMRRVADTTANGLNDSNGTNGDRTGAKGGDSIPYAMGEAIALICQHLGVTKIVAITISGYAARVVAAKNPSQPILAVSNDLASARRFNIMRGVTGVHVDIPFSRTNMDHIPACLEALWRSGELIEEDLVLVTAVGYPRSGNRMNLIETHRVGDLRASLGW